MNANGMSVSVSCPRAFCARLLLRVSPTLCYGSSSSATSHAPPPARLPHVPPPETVVEGARPMPLASITYDYRFIMQLCVRV